MSDIGEILNHQRCRFDIFTIFVPLSQLSEAIKARLENEAEYIKRKLHLKACYMILEGQDFVKGQKGEEEKEILDRWLDLLVKGNFFYFGPTNLSS